MIRHSALTVTVITAILAAIVLVSACSPRTDRVAPVPNPASPSDHLSVQGAHILASPYLDAEAAQARFGFDARGAGLLPVYLVIDNRGRAVIRINPAQTFLIDLDGQAWPLLSSEQAGSRVSRALELNEMAAGGGKAAALLGAAGAATGFALSVILGRGIGTPVAQGAAVGSALGMVSGASDATYDLGSQVRQELTRKSFRNNSVRPNELAHGVLFFPGRDEARTAKSLRLSLEFDGYPTVIEVPMKMPLPYIKQDN